MSSSLPETVREFQNSTIENINSYKDPTSCSFPSLKSRSNPLKYEKLLNICRPQNVYKIIDDIYNIDIESFGVCDKEIFNRVSNINSSNQFMDINYAEYINNALCNLYLIKYLSKNQLFNKDQITQLKDWSKTQLITYMKSKERVVNNTIAETGIDLIGDKLTDAEEARRINDLNARFAKLKSGGSRSIKRRKTHRRKSKKRRGTTKRRGTKQRQQGIKRRRTKSRR